MLKLIVVWQLADHPMVQPDVGLDTTAYADLARRVVGGDLGLGPGLYYVSPLYIYVLAAGLALTDSFTAVRILQALAGAWAVGGIWLITRAWSTPRAAWCAGILAAITGLFTFYEALILQASIDTVLTTLALLALTWALHARGARWYVVAGAVFGLASLNRPNMMVAGAALAAVLLLSRRMRPALLLAIGIVVGMSPVMIRNVVVSGQWSLVSSHGGLNLYIGNSADATGFYHTVPGITPDIAGQSRDAKKVAEAALGRTLSDSETSDYFLGLATAWMREHPMQAAGLFLKKLGFVFHAQHIALPYSYPFYAYDAGTALRFYVVGPWLLVPLGLVGLGVLVRRGPDPVPALIWISFVPAYAVSVAIFFIAERYRLPILVPLCVGAGVALDALATAVSARQWRSLALPAAVGMAILVAVNWKTSLSDGRWDEGIRTAERLVILGRDAEVDTWLTKLAPTAPKPGLAQSSVGMQYLVEGKYDRAAQYLGEAHRLNPDDANVEYGLGQALLQAGRAEEALPHLQSGFDRGANVPMPGYNLALALQATGDLGGAAAVIREISPQPPDDPEVWMRMGRLASSVQAPDVAERFFRQAVQLAPAKADARLQYGLNLLVLNRIPEAARELSEAARLDPRNPDALAHLAYCELALGRQGDAVRHAEAALALDPSNAMALAVLGKR